MIIAITTGTAGVQIALPFYAQTFFGAPRGEFTGIISSFIKLIAKKDIKNHFFGQKWLWFDGGFALGCGCVFLVNFYLAWVQRFDLVGSLGDILGYLPTKFEGPSWSGLVTVGLWSQICAFAKRGVKWYRKSHKRRISPASRMRILTHELLSDAQSIIVQHLFACLPVCQNVIK